MAITSEEKNWVDARVRIIMNYSFFDALLLSLNSEPSDRVERVGTDGATLLYNPEWTQAQKPMMIIYTIVHTLTHMVMLHPFRMRARNKVIPVDGGEVRLWDIATDYAVNHFLKENMDDRRLELPSDAILDSYFEKMSAEEIYDALLKEAEERPDIAKNRASDFKNQKIQGECIQSESVTSEELSASEQLCKERVENAAESCLRTRGTTPNKLAAKIRSVNKTPLDYRILLNNMMTSYDKSDYSWAMPNRRLLHRGLYLPSLHAEAMGDISIIIDTSGSIDLDMLSKFENEINGLSEQLNPESVQVIYCDSDVAGVDSFAQGENIVFNPVGGGGTDMQPAIDICTGDVIICLTDLYIGEPQPPKSGAPVYWITGEKNPIIPAFGKVGYIPK